MLKIIFKPSTQIIAVFIAIVFGVIFNSRIVLFGALLVLAILISRMEV